MISNFKTMNVIDNSETVRQNGLLEILNNNSTVKSLIIIYGVSKRDFEDRINFLCRHGIFSECDFEKIKFIEGNVNDNNFTRRLREFIKDGYQNFYFHNIHKIEMDGGNLDKRVSRVVSEIIQFCLEKEVGFFYSSEVF